MDQRRGKQSPPLLSWLSALYKCLFVVKLRVKAPPCGRSLALAQVNAVFTGGGSTKHHPRRYHATAQPPRRSNHHQTWRRPLWLKSHKHPAPFVNLKHVVTATCTHVSVIPVNYENEVAPSTSYAFVL